MKKLVFVILLSIFIISGCTLSEQSNHADLVEIFSDINELMENSPIVVEAIATEKSEKFSYEDVTFYKTQLKISHLYRDFGGELLNKEQITLLQNDIAEDPLVQQGQNLLLFLKKYEGPVIEDAYRLVGLVQGHFTIENGKIIAKADDHFQISKDSNTLSRENLEIRLENHPYKPSNHYRMTDEEIEEENRRELEMYEKQKNNNK